MKKSTKIVLGVVTIVVIMFVVASYLGVIDLSVIWKRGVPDNENIPPTPEGGMNLNLSDLELFSILQVMFHKTLNYAQVQPYFDALRMEGYGRDDMDAQQLRQWAEANYAQAGWTSQGTTTQYAADWVAYHEAWTMGADARSISVAEGAGVTAVFNHEIAYIVSHGPATTYWQFWNVVK
jgi:hypothetical protein